VVEADESDASFLNLLPVMAVVTNIDADHMETYGHDFNRLKAAFVDFLHRMPFYGTAILCTDDAAVRQHRAEVSCPITSYGFDADAQVRAVDVRAVGGQMLFTVQRRNGETLPDLPVVLNLAGRHNVLNALAAIAVAVRARRGRCRSAKGAGGVQGRRAPLPDPTATMAAADGGCGDPDRRLRPPPGRNCRPRWPLPAALSRAGGWCWPSSPTATPAPGTASTISCM
jgi:UDP-N-acetylmuramate--alanine ligase